MQCSPTFDKRFQKETLVGLMTNYENPYVLKVTLSTARTRLHFSWTKENLPFQRNNTSSIKNFQTILWHKQFVGDWDVVELRVLVQVEVYV